MLPIRLLKYTPSKALLPVFPTLQPSLLCAAIRSFPSLLTHSAVLFWLRLLSVLMICCFLPAYAADNNGQVTTPTALEMVENIAKQIPAVMRLVTAISYVLGMVFIFKGVVQLKHLGESRTMMSQEHSIAGPLVYFGVGAMLLYFPTTVQVGLSTFWSNPNPYSYVQEGAQWAQLYSAVFLVIQLLGTIAFIRGLLILSHLGGGHSQQGAFGRGLTHIIGGIFCINIYQFVQVITTTLGIDIGGGN